MNHAQKVSWALVISISLALIVVIAGLVVRHLGAGSAQPFVYVAAGVIVAGVIFVFRLQRDPGPVTSDERDKLIEKNANLAGFGAVYLFVIAASFAPIAIFGENGSLPVTWCPALLIGAGFCQAYAQSIAILIQYGRPKKGEQE